MLKIKSLVYALWPFLLTSNAIAGEYRECVGRYELTLPGEVDVATTTPMIFGDRPIESPIQFTDGQPGRNLPFGGEKSFVYNGEFDVIEGVSEVSVDELLRRNRAFISSSKDEADPDKRLSEVSVERPHSLVVFGTHSARFYTYMESRLVRFSTHSTGMFGDDEEISRHRVMDMLEYLSARRPYEVPAGDGVCLPGIFIWDLGSDYGRRIGVTFRLKEHPDVTVYFLDRSIGSPQMTPKQESDFVWRNGAIGKKVRLRGPLHYRPVKIADSQGITSFATVTRYDGSTDYAYLAVVHDESDAIIVDTPYLELLVERTAKNAKGVPPVSGDQLEDIAKAIAASVKRRPVQ